MDKDRLKTGALLILGVVLVAWIDSLLLTWLVLGVAYMFAFYEAMKLYKVEDNSMYVYAAILWLLSLIYQNPDDLIFVAFIVAISYMLYKGKLEKEKLLPLLYPTASFLFLFALYKGFGMEALIWLTIVVALTDTGAYFSGRKFGKRQFNPISPKKTWEGVIGGVIVATIFGAWYGASFVSGSLAIFVSLLVSISSIYGDLYESFLKRRAGVKDSGNILPGHGGVLDRVDGFMFASIMMVVLLRGLA
jgi:phosphatidate cytidylyltransferase